jgi:membrane protease YdiL (CAAX protease family)
MDDPLLALCRLSLRAEGVIGAIALAGACLGGRGVGRRLGLTREGRRIGGAGLGWLVLGTLGLSHALDALLALTGLGERSALAHFPELLAGARGERLLLALVALGLAPAVAEELLCRGLLQRALAARLGPGIGIALAAGVFGALHVEPIHAGFALLLGLYLGAVAHWAGHTWAAIACHAVNNLLAVGLGALGWQTPTGPVSLLLGLGLAAACAWRGQRESARSRPPKPLQREPGSDDG